jgi:hypothetical protein
MISYYIHNGVDKEGPFDIATLRSKGLKQNTPVWWEGLADWTEAAQVEGLRDLFSGPPPFEKKEPPKVATPETKQADPKAREEESNRKIGHYMRLTGVVILLALGVYFGLAYVQSTSRTSTYEDKVMTVEEIERANPRDFLDASGTWNENFWGNKLKVQGTVTSSATVATYKDVVIKVTYYSATRTVLGTQSYVLYKYVPPRSTIKFDWTLDRPKNCERLDWDVVSASDGSN